MGQKVSGNKQKAEDCLTREEEKNLPQKVDYYCLKPFYHSLVSSQIKDFLVGFLSNSDLHIAIIKNVDMKDVQDFKSILTCAQKDATDNEKLQICMCQVESMCQVEKLLCFCLFKSRPEFQQNYENNFIKRFELIDTSADKGIVIFTKFLDRKITAFFYFSEIYRYTFTNVPVSYFTIIKNTVTKIGVQQNIKFKIKSTVTKVSKLNVSITKQNVANDTTTPGYEKSEIE